VKRTSTSLLPPGAITIVSSDSIAKLPLPARYARVIVSATLPGLRSVIVPLFCPSQTYTVSKLTDAEAVVNCGAARSPVSITVCEMPHGEPLNTSVDG